MIFPVSGVETPVWLPVLVAFVISFFTSMAGVSGAFLLLPFQMSVLGFSSPAVSPTNLVFNIVGIPGGVYRYIREGRMVWPLTWVVVAGTAPGVVLGGLIRLSFLPDPKPFKAFVGCVLLYIGARLFLDVARASRKAKEAARECKPDERPIPRDWNVRTLTLTWRSIAFEFQGLTYGCKTLGILVLSFIVGIIGGIYGIGGGAIIAPFFVAIYRLPVHAVAGAALMGTFITSVFGVAFYQLIAPFYEGGAVAVAPDWLLGLLFGVGGLGGMYLGARTQRFVPAAALKTMLGAIASALALCYIIAYLTG
jgi:hypothetical protein